MGRKRFSPYPCCRSLVMSLVTASSCRCRPPRLRRQRLAIHQALFQALLVHPSIYPSPDWLCKISYVRTHACALQRSGVCMWRIQRDDQGTGLQESLRSKKVDDFHAWMNDQRFLIGRRLFSAEAGRASLACISHYSLRLHNVTKNRCWNQKTELKHRVMHIAENDAQLKMLGIESASTCLLHAVFISSFRRSS